MKYNDEYLKTICEENNCIFCFSQIEQVNNKSRRYIYYICNKHSKFGEQKLTVEKFASNKKKCQYCNHSKLKEIFAEEVASITPTIQVLDEYSTWNTPVLCKCLKCGHEWKGRVTVLLYGGDCPKCARKKANAAERLSMVEVEKRIKNAFPNAMIIGEYKGVHSLLRCKCLIHKCEWESTPAHLFKGEAGCPECKKEKMRDIFALGQEEFETIAKEKNPNIIIKGKYVNRDTNLKCFCLVHKNTFYANPRSLMYKSGNVCPLCFQSMGEQRLISLLKNNGYKVSLQYKFDDCVYKKPLRFDAYDCEHKIAYEYQGEQHYRPINFNGYDVKKSEEEFELNQIRDQIKRDYCKKNNIHLIEIPYWEYDNMEEILRRTWITYCSSHESILSCE